MTIWKVVLWLFSTLICVVVKGEADKANQLVSKVVKTTTHKFIAKADHSARADVEYISPAHPDIRHAVMFAIQQRNLDLIFSTLDDVSDPTSSNYGKHWSNAKIQEMTQNSEGFEAVKGFLQSYHRIEGEAEGVVIVKESQHKHYLLVEAKVSTWEDMFATKFHSYHVADYGNGKGSAVNGKRVAVCGESLSLPVELTDHVSGVFHAIDLPVPIYSGLMKHNDDKLIRADDVNSMLQQQHGNLRSDEFSSQDYLSDKVYPQKLNTIYDVESNSGTLQTTQAIFATIGQVLSLSDLRNFQQMFELKEQNITQNIGGNVIGKPCTGNGNDCTEANLDIQYMMAMAQNMSTTFYYWDDNLYNDVWLSWIMEVGEMDDPPSVFSISYASYEDYLNANYLRSFDSEAAKLSLQGVTLIAASGDDGVGGFNVRGHPNRCGYFNMFPASSPYVTALGGSQGPEVGDTEVACQSSRSTGVLITSGGGVSTRRSTPSWQTGLLSEYFKSVSTSPSGFSSTSGRGFPDISLLAHSYVVVTANSIISVDGTSASSPTFAGMLSLVNQQRLNQGKSTVGWLNPALYKYAEYFVRDITSGDNKCSALYGSLGSSTCCAQGFYAAPGWDPVTGLGSLDFQRFYSVFALNDTSSLVYNDDDNGISSSSSSSGLTTVQTIIVVLVVVAGVGFILGILFAACRSMLCESRPAGTRYMHTPTVAVLASAPPETSVVVVHAQQGY